MSKVTSLLFFLLFLSLSSISQRKAEHIVISWPGEYNWKIVQQANDENKQTSMIIPGDESPQTASIFGSLKAFRGVKYTNLEEIIDSYRARLDSGTTLTLIEKQQSAKYPWVLFKVETPVTNKYPEPESDLYYVVQGKFGLYENFVGIKAATLNSEFVKKWTAVFMTSKITTD
jgi:hypothetical protein